MSRLTSPMPPTPPTRPCCCVAVRCIDEASVFDGSAGENFDLPLLQARRGSVDDAVTARFMARFEQERQLGCGPAEALSEAQADGRVNHPPPAFWSGFVRHGGG